MKRKLIKIVLIVFGVLLLLVVLSISLQNVRMQKAVKMARDLCKSSLRETDLKGKRAIEFFQRNEDLFVPALIEVLRDKNQSDVSKTLAVNFLAERKDKRATLPLLELLQDDNWRLRFFASQALGQIGDKRATESLMQAWLNETQKDIHQEKGNPWAVQREIALALAKIGDKRAVPAFLKTYQNESKEIQLLSAMVLYKLVEDVAYLNALADAVHSEDYKIRGKVIWTLGDLGDQKMIPLLQDVLDDTDPKIRDIAQKAIEKLKTKSNLNNQQNP
jgi:hypothetical protein